MARVSRRIGSIPPGKAAVEQFRTQQGVVEIVVRRKPGGARAFGILGLVVDEQAGFAAACPALPGKAGTRWGRACRVPNCAEQNDRAVGTTGNSGGQMRARLSRSSSVVVGQDGHARAFAPLAGRTPAPRALAVIAAARAAIRSAVVYRRAQPSRQFVRVSLGVVQAQIGFVFQAGLEQRLRNRAFAGAGTLGQHAQRRGA